MMKDKLVINYINYKLLINFFIVCSCPTKFQQGLDNRLETWHTVFCQDRKPFGFREMSFSTQVWYKFLKKVSSNLKAVKENS